MPVLSDHKLHNIVNRSINRSFGWPVSVGVAAVSFLVLFLGLSKRSPRIDGNERFKEEFRTAQQILRLVPLPAGAFMMGSEDRLDDEQPVTRVTISKEFWLGATEVTQAQYQAVMENIDPSIDTNLAAADVSWDEAIEFCRRLTARAEASGWLPDGYEFTLPTEAQWEYACRAGTTGDDASDVREMGWYSGNAILQTQSGRVGKKRANAWGLHDMHGNKWEWCLDWYGPYPGGNVTDPAGPLSGQFRVGRGGSSNHLADRCRSAARNYDVPSYKFSDLGFRLALSPITPRIKSRKKNSRPQL